MPTPLKIHYAPPSPKFKQMRCSYGGEGTLETTDPNQVTCRNCLRLIQNKKVGRPQKSEKAKAKITAFALSPEAWEKIQQVPKNKRSQWVNQLILEN